MCSCRSNQSHSHISRLQSYTRCLVTSAEPLVTQASETRIKYIYHTGCKSSSTKYNPTMINLYAYHDDAAEEVPSNPSYTNHASTIVMTPCAVRHQRGERHRRAWLIL